MIKLWKPHEKPNFGTNNNAPKVEHRGSSGRVEQGCGVSTVLRRPWSPAGEPSPDVPRSDFWASSSCICLVRLGSSRSSMQLAAHCLQWAHGCGRGFGRAERHCDAQRSICHGRAYRAARARARAQCSHASVRANVCVQMRACGTTAPALLSQCALWQECTFFEQKPSSSTRKHCFNAEALIIAEGLLKAVQPSQPVLMGLGVV